MQVESSATLLTIDEATEDTISAFQENDAAVDLRLNQEQVCLNIDSEGFEVQRNFKCVKWVITLGTQRPVSQG